MTQNMNEELLLANIDRQAEIFTQKHEALFDAVAGSRIFGSNTRQFGKMDAVVLGRQLEQYAAYEAYVRENASASDLGTLPQIATDLIAAVYGLSIAPIVSSMQTIEEQSGIIYFKQVAAKDTRGGITAGDNLVAAKSGWNKTMDGYMSESVQDEVHALTTATSQTVTLNAHPIRSNIAIPVTLGAYPTFVGQIVGGSLLHNGVVAVTGTLNYSTGELVLTFASAPTAGDMKVSYHQDFEKSDDIPEVEFTLTTDTVMAEVLALKELIGTLKSFQFNKRFGKTASDEALADLSGALAAAESQKVIKAAVWLATKTGGAVTWSKTNPGGISEFEHRQSFRYALNTADTKIGTNAGRGFVNRYIAGYEACEYFRSLNGFTLAAPNTGVGAHLYGYLDGVPVIRAHARDGIATNKVIGLYVNPTSPFEAPIVTATYMPVFLTNTIQMSNNPLQNQRAIASWKAFKPVVEQFAIEISIDT